MDFEDRAFWKRAKKEAADKARKESANGASAPKRKQKRKPPEPEPEPKEDPSPHPGKLETLQQAIEWLAARKDKGCRCPCCKQFAKIYKRTLNRTMIKALLIMARAGACTDYRHSPTILSQARAKAANTGDMGKLAYFGLVQECPLKRPDGGRAGWWKITEQGKAFMQGKIRLPKYAFVYDDVVIEHSGEEIGIREVEPEFRLDDLMNDQ